VVSYFNVEVEKNCPDVVEANWRVPGPSKEGVLVAAHVDVLNVPIVFTLIHGVPVDPSDGTRRFLVVVCGIIVFAGVDVDFHKSSCSIVPDPPPND